MNKHVTIAAPPEVVWTWLTEADKLAVWFHRADADLEPGAPYVLRGPDGDGRQVKKCWGEVLEMDPPKRLVYSFTIAPLAGHMTTVTWELESVAGGTRLSLTHEGLDDDATVARGLFDALDGGWNAHLDALVAKTSNDGSTPVAS